MMINKVNKFNPFRLFQFSKQIIEKQHQHQSKESMQQLLSPNLEKPNIIIHKEDDYKYVEDYTKSETKVEFDSEDSSSILESKMTFDGKEVTFRTNTRSSIELKDNPLAQQVLRDQSIDLNDSRIAIKTQMSKEISNENLNQIDLGKVYVMPENTIHLSEVDVDNIPEDKDIQIDREEKQLYAIGTKSDEVNESEKLNINKTIVEDFTFQEYKDKHLFKFEQSLVIMNKKEYLKSIIRRLPIYFFIYCLCETFWEYYHIRKQIFELEEQELMQTEEYLSQIQKEMLLNDPLFRN